MAFVTDRMETGKVFRVLTLIDQYRRERPVENGFIESFNEKLRDECLN